MSFLQTVSVFDTLCSKNTIHLYSLAWQQHKQKSIKIKQTDIHTYIQIVKLYLHIFVVYYDPKNSGWRYYFFGRQLYLVCNVGVTYRPNSNCLWVSLLKCIYDFLTQKTFAWVSKYLCQSKFSRERSLTV